MGWKPMPPMTHLCVPIFLDSIEQARRDMASAAEAGADLVELRIDRLVDIHQVRQLTAQTIIPCIVTCRPTWEGGESELEDEQRLELLAVAASSDSVAYVDIELKTIQRRRANLPPDKLILSSHDFATRPAKPHNLLIEMDAVPAAVNKIAWRARTVRDNLEAFELLRDRRRPTIALCMGEAGIPSRVLAKKFGAFLTFASLHDGAESAPGQLSITDMKRLYRWDALGGKTKFFGVVGSPIAHSMSPAIHNASFERTGYDGVYLPLLVNEGYESFKAFMESFRAFEPLDLAGLSITLPHKENALRYLKERGGTIEAMAERIGAVNTISFHPALRGISTDYSAILDSLCDALGVDRSGLSGLRVAVIGAGGTGRTAVAALAHCGATVVVYNRTRERADKLAEEFNGHSGKVVAANMEKLCDSCCQVFINTTSIGMHPNVDASPWGEGPAALPPDTVVFDAVYNPMETKFLRQARAAGAKSISGVEMFVRQAAAQFETWTGATAPTDVMRNVVESRLSTV
jgi:3-dehydroquinate dehydratase/shikimate dehydrogenase